MESLIDLLKKKESELIKMIKYCNANIVGYSEKKKMYELKLKQTRKDIKKYEL